MDVFDAMRVGEARYAAPLDSLRKAGFPAFFTQTGGMCAALQVQLERGHLLVTDAEDELPWQPEQLRGWGVGYYETGDVSVGPIAFVDSGNTSGEALVGLVRDCLRETAAVARMR